MRAPVFFVGLFLLLNAPQCIAQQYCANMPQNSADFFNCERINLQREKEKHQNRKKTLDENLRQLDFLVQIVDVETIIESQLRLSRNSTDRERLLVGETGEHDVYMVPASIEKKERLATVWILIDIKSRPSSKISKEKLFWSIAYLREYDCGGKQVRLQSSHLAYHGRMLKGTGVFMGDAVPTTPQWVTIRPGSTEEYIWEITCGKL